MLNIISNSIRDNQCSIRENSEIRRSWADGSTADWCPFPLLLPILQSHKAYLKFISSIEEINA
jgi:hypothetical protein